MNSPVAVTAIIIVPYSDDDNDDAICNGDGNDVSDYDGIYDDDSDKSYFYGGPEKE